jgi:hypothetical protein
MKTLILTIDYELFYGEKEGSVNSCMIEPTNLLMNLLAKYESTMTVFWDVLHFWKLKELSGKHAMLAKEAIKIEEQIQKLAEAHHDIQLHLHPHWINTTFDGRDWQFNLGGYRLHSLAQKNDLNDINSISGCVKIGKNLIEETVRKVHPGYIVNTFRAGGYCIQPFDKLAQVFSTNGILIDSSVCYGFKINKGEHSYDFTSIPRKENYKFETDIKKEDPEGKFSEFPIGSIKVTPFQILWWAFLRRLKYRNLKPLGEIDSSGRNEKKEEATISNLSKIVRKGLNIILKNNYIMLTPDNFFGEKFNYLVKHANEGSVMILHPKYLNYHTLGLLENHLKTGNIRFISLRDKIEQNI